MGPQVQAGPRVGQVDGLKATFQECEDVIFGTKV
jgi:hypothetical protein